MSVATKENVIFYQSINKKSSNQTTLDWKSIAKPINISELKPFYERAEYSASRRPEFQNVFKNYKHLLFWFSSTQILKTIQNRLSEIKTDLESIHDSLTFARASANLIELVHSGLIEEIPIIGVTDDTTLVVEWRATGLHLIITQNGVSELYFNHKAKKYEVSMQFSGTQNESSNAVVLSLISQLLSHAATLPTQHP